MVGLATVALSSCSDYLDTDAPSKLIPEEVYGSTREAERALNGVYAAMLSSDTYGKTFLKELTFNTDVDFSAESNRQFSPTGYRRYECDPDGSTIKKVWDAQYAGIGRANMLIYGLENSPIYDKEDPDPDVAQILGEAKVLRAIFYHDLVWYFGDVPYTRLPANVTQNTIYDVKDRTEILKDMINDLIEAAPNMKLSSETGWTDGVERVSKEMAWAMIARLAMTAGGYSLRPEGAGLYGTMKRPDNYLDFYQIARDYAYKVMTESNHSLNSEYYEVFVRECNFEANVTNDDVIFEIPFAQESTGSIGYIQGPKMDIGENSKTNHSWGKSDASAQLNAAYMYFFDEKDKRRGFINQLFGYNNKGEAQFNNGYTVYNGKWSKLWNRSGLGDTSDDNTGINFPYMRFTDVLLMFAEAENELKGGPTAEAKAALEQVRARAFRGMGADDKITAYGTSKEDFLESVLNERKLEFAGENMRWRDLVRNNKLNEVVYWAYMRYYQLCQGEMDDALDNYDNIDWSKTFVNKYYYFSDYPRYTAKKDTYAYDESEPGYLHEWEFPQTSPNMNIVWVLNRFCQPRSNDSKAKYKLADGTSMSQGSADNSWQDGNTQMPKAQLRYCLRGYMNCDEDKDVIQINDNGTYVTAPAVSSNPTADQLPVIRYILPYPRAVITKSMGKYSLKYGYK